MITQEHLDKLTELFAELHTISAKAAQDPMTYILYLVGLHKQIHGALGEIKKAPGGVETIEAADKMFAESDMRAADSVWDTRHFRKI